VGQEGHPAKKKLGVDGQWGQLGPAPPDHCHGCHEVGHFFYKCPKRPDNHSTPAHLTGKSGERPRSKGKGKGKRPDASMGESEDDSDADVYLAEAEAASALPAGARRPKRDSTWIVDSGASYIFTPYESDFSGPLTEPITDQVRVGNGTVTPHPGPGDSSGPESRWEGADPRQGCAWVPAMHSRLLSVGHFTDKGAKAVFEGTTCKVYGKGKLLFTGSRSQQRGQWAPQG